MESQWKLIRISVWRESHSELILESEDRNFFSISIFFTDTDDSQDSRGREETIFYSTLPLPPAHEHSDIYLQLCMWDDYHIFLIATLVFTRLLLDEIYHLIELPFEWLIDDAMFVCLLDELILGFCYSDLTLETGGFELASTITFVLQVNRLTKCASHPKNKSKRVTARDPSRRVNHLSKVIQDRTIHQVYQFHQNRLELKSTKHIGRWVDWQNVINVRWNRIKNCA